MPAFQDLTGQRFGRLTVIERAENRGKATRWSCQCDCGNISTASANHLKIGHTASCGCLVVDVSTAKATKHGGYNTAEYMVWAGMLRRTRNPNDTHYKDYGGRGITVCKRWRDSFANFIADMGLRPTPKHSIERRNNNLGYSPKNCCWATNREQSLNKRSNRLIKYRGQVKTIHEWAEIMGIKYTTLYMRLTRLDMTLEEAFIKPVGRWAK